VQHLDFRNLDENGLTICPQCGRHYRPALGERPKGDNRPIQEIFPNAKPFEREQLITGLCSDKCWRKHVLGTAHNLGIRGKVIKQLREELGREPTESEIQTSLKSIDENMG